jgi:hypothetical protein
VALLLRASSDVRGVTLVEWLLSSPATPLDGFELEPLRWELWRPEALDDLGLKNALRALVASVARDARLDVAADIDGDLPAIDA